MKVQNVSRILIVLELKSKGMPISLHLAPREISRELTDVEITSRHVQKGLGTGGFLKEVKKVKEAKAKEVKEKPTPAPKPEETKKSKHS